ncbi:hypothetical protein [Clostridium akagii]|uniref:hypothetical protein n=1 Tax=Clostridium akagii TaxID=91623 RepID=UPI00047A530B|nr:hypothetical protein [Clostridium akagii]
MKGIFIKNMSLVLSLVTVMSFGVSQSAQAATNANTIPSKATAGTNIKYDNNNNMVILNGNISSTSINSSLPKPQPGMTVSYDGTGEPTFIKINGKAYSNKLNTKNGTLSPSYRNGSYSNSGAISWYDDQIGQGNHTLTNYDCATDEYADNCPLGTNIYVASSGNYFQLKKWDVGNLQAQSTPRIIDIWSAYEFSYLLDVSANQGLVRNASYSHY